MKSLAILWLSCVVGAAAVPAWAQPLAQERAPSVAAPAVSAAGPTAQLFQDPVAAQRLEDYRGGTDTVHNDMKLAGITAGNTAIEVTTGSNAIGSGAFSGMSGLPVVIQNSGANVLIQNAVILHLDMN